MDNGDIIDELKNCKSAVTSWGHTNQVELDASKENFVVLHKRYGQGDGFRLSGSLVDVCFNAGRSI